MRKTIYWGAQAFALFGFFFFTTASAQSASGSGGIGGATIFAGISTILAVLLAAYMRVIEAKTDKKADTENVNIQLRQTDRIQELFVAQQKENTAMIRQHSEMLHRLELVLAQQHPTKLELQNAVATALGPVMTQLSQMQKSIEELKKEMDNE